MSTFDESKVRREQGKFANKDAQREEAGQVNLGAPPPTKIVFADDLRRGDVVVQPDGSQLTIRDIEQGGGRTKFYVEGDDEPYVVDSFGDVLNVVDSDPEPEEPVDRSYIGQTIRSQVQNGVLMSLGAHNLRTTDNGLAFKARMLAFKQDGTRGGRVKNMDVDISLNGLDYYDIKVTDGDKIHAEMSDVDVSSLNRTLLALDYDGDEPFNPRYVGGGR